MASATLSIKVKGGKALANKLSTVMKNAKKTLRTELTREAMEIRKAAIPATPRDLGNLRRSSFVVCDGVIYAGSGPKFVDRVARGRKRRGVARTPRKVAARMAREHKSSLEWAKMRAGTTPIKTSAIIGYSAFYAANVHETPKNYVVGGPMFLKNAISGRYRSINNRVRMAMIKAVYK